MRNEAILGVLPETEKRNRIVDLHRSQELYAKKIAKRVVKLCRLLDRRKIEAPVLYGLLRQYGVADDHCKLAADIFHATINSDLQ